MSSYSRKQAIRVRRKKMFIQKLMGVSLLTVSVLILLVAMQGQTVEERDCTVLFLTVPLSLCLIFSRSIIIY